MRGSGSAASNVPSRAAVGDLAQPPLGRLRQSADTPSPASGTRWRGPGACGGRSSALDGRRAPSSARGVRRGRDRADARSRPRAIDASTCRATAIRPSGVALRPSWASRARALRGLRRAPLDAAADVAALSLRRADDAVDPLVADLLGGQFKPELLDHDAGEEAAHRMLLPAGRLHDGRDGRALRRLQHRDDVGLLGVGPRAARCLFGRRGSLPALAAFRRRLRGWRRRLWRLGRGSSSMRLFISIADPDRRKPGLGDLQRMRAVIARAARPACRAWL